MLKIAQGAEAILYQKDKQVLKERVVKDYRLPQIDYQLRKFRTRREAKVLKKLEEIGFPAPRLYFFCDKKMSLSMEFIPGPQLKDSLEKENIEKVAKELGKKIALLHQNNLIHGDLTTSNIIKHEETGELFFIDFGLSFFSDRIEDKAVDLFLLDRALESKHYQFYPLIFEKILKSYQEAWSKAYLVLERLEEVKKRGRNKQKRTQTEIKK